MGYSSENLVVVPDPGVSRLLDRLKKGQLIKSRIVLVLEDNRYLLRIHGYNLIMESALKFKRKEEILIEVQQTRPKLKLRLVKKSNLKSGTDLIV